MDSTQDMTKNKQVRSSFNIYIGILCFNPIDEANVYQFERTFVQLSVAK